MVTVLVIAHSPLASALVQAARHVYSRDPCAAARQLLGLDVQPDAPAASVLAQATALMGALDPAQGVLVLTDVAGATPGNVAARLAVAGKVAVLAGVNLPMLLRALCYGESSLTDLVIKASTGGTNGVQELTAPTTLSLATPPRSTAAANR